MLRIRIVAVASTAALMLIACGQSADPTPPAGGQSASESPASSGKVVTKLLTFDPEKITVKAGTTVTWQVSDSIGHTVTTGTFTLGGDGLRSEERPDGKIDKKLAKGQDVSFTFDQPGTYTYFCSIHKGMNGEVEVTP
ncbi:cupredoxin domain-containing protein [Actinosynnema sp. CA-248983]